MASRAGGCREGERAADPDRRRMLGVPMAADEADAALTTVPCDLRLS